MGGKALKSVETRRYMKNEYEIAKDKVLSILAQFLVGRFDATRTYGAKESFGDLDIVVEDVHDAKKIITENIDKLNPDEIYKNGNMWSINYNDLQVDFIFAESQFYQSTLDYLAFNDVGMLIGDLAKRTGFKLSTKGLEYQLKDDNNNIIGNISVTDNYLNALVFLGYNQNEFKKGFENLGDIFDYVMSSPLARKEYFLPENQTNDERRNRTKRPNYILFLDYLEEREYDTENNLEQNFFFEKALKEFPNFKTNLEKLKIKIENEIKIKEKINFNKVKKETNISGIESKLFSIYLNKYCLKNNILNNIINYDESEVIDLIRTIHTSYLSDNSYTNYTGSKNIYNALINGGFDIDKKEFFNAINNKTLFQEAAIIEEPMAMLSSYCFFNIKTYISLINKNFNTKLDEKSIYIDSILKKESITSYMIIKDPDSFDSFYDRMKLARSKIKDKNKKPTFNFAQIENVKSYSEKKIMCIDVEMYEKDKNIITEVGFSVLKDDTIQTRHFIISENYEFNNGVYVENNKLNFNFGESEKVSLNEAINIIKSEIRNTDFIIGNKVSDDIKLVFGKEFLSSIQKKVFNSDNMIYFHKDVEYFDLGSHKRNVAISTMLDKLEIKYSNLHNAGNDAHYNILVYREIIDNIKESNKNVNKSKRKVSL